MLSVAYRLRACGCEVLARWGRGRRRRARLAFFARACARACGCCDDHWPSLLTKTKHETTTTVYELESVGIDGKKKLFQKPWMMTLAMFVGARQLCRSLLRAGLLLLAKRILRETAP
jgi:hypothetical protein